MVERSARPKLPDDLAQRLQRALDDRVSPARSGLRLLLGALKEDLFGQAAVILAPGDADHLTFIEATDAAFLAGDLPDVPVATSIAGFVFLSGQSMALDNARKSARHYSEIDERSGFVTQEYLAVPIVQEGEVIGVLTVANRSQPLDEPLFSAQEIQLAAQYADICAPLLTCETNIGRQIAETGEDLRRWFSGTRNGREHGDASGGSEHGLEVLRAQLHSATRDLTAADLELVFDLTTRLAQSASEQA